MTPLTKFVSAQLKLLLWLLLLLQWIISPGTCTFACPRNCALIIKTVLSSSYDSYSLWYSISYGTIISINLVQLAFALLHFNTLLYNRVLPTLWKQLVEESHMGVIVRCPQMFGHTVYIKVVCGCFKGLSLVYGFKMVFWSVYVLGCIKTDNLNQRHIFRASNTKACHDMRSKTEKSKSNTITAH